MDEIDAIGGKRFSEGTSSDREIQRTLMEVCGLAWARPLSLSVQPSRWRAVVVAVSPRPVFPCLIVGGVVVVGVLPLCEQLLNQMDGFDALGQVKIVMATNRPDILDPALMRPVSHRCVGRGGSATQPQLLELVVLT